MRFLVILFIFVRHILGQGNNVCKTIEDYSTIQTNKNCWYDYTTGATGPEILMKSGRPFETYKVTTSDGFILTMFRIGNQNSRTKKENPVFLQHGLVSASDNWIALGNNSLAFQLNDRGYDVWLGNYRGNRYSTAHVRYSIHDDSFWDHSMDELALIDIPSMLNTISNATGHRNKIIYVGHSLGCTLGLMYTSESPQEAQKLLKYMILTAPAYLIPHVKSPLKLIVPFADIILSMVYKLGLVNIVSNEKVVQGLVRLVCLNSPYNIGTCVSSSFDIYGPKTGIKPEQYPKLLMMEPAGTSIKVIKHASEMVKNHFRKYDYGSNNINIYGSLEPPSYNITKITVPTVVIYAKNDWLTPKEDSLILYEHLARESRYGICEVDDDNFNHIDFIYGSTAKTVFVDLVVKIFEKLQDI